MERDICVVLVALILALAAVVLGCELGGYWRDTKMAGLGYEQAMVSGYRWPVWRRAEAR